MKAKQTTHRLLAVLLCLAMLLSMAPALQLFSQAQAAAQPTHEAHGTHEGWETLPAKGSLSGKYVVPEGGFTMEGLFSLEGDTHICLNGQTIIPKADAGHVFYVSGGYTLTLCDCAGGGKVDASSLETTTNNGMIRLNGGNVDMYGGTYTGHTTSKYTGGVWIQTGSTFNMFGGTISDCTNASDSKLGGAFLINGGTLNVYGGEISGNTATRGGAIYADNAGTILISGGTISGNTSTDTRNQDIYMTGGCKLNFTGAPVFENVTVRYGGSDASTISALEPGASIYLPTDASVTADDTATVEADETTGMTHYYKPAENKNDHSCKTHGDHEGWQTLPANGSLTAGDYVVPEGGLTMQGLYSVADGDVHICLNGQTIIPKAGAGHVFYVTGGYKLTLCDCKGTGKVDASSLETTTNNGMIRLNGGNVDMYGGTYTGHTTSKYTGGVWIQTGTTFNMFGGTISDCTNASDSKLGGAFLINGGTLNISGGEISGNEAKRGGAIYADGGATIMVSGGTISGNTSTDTDRPQDIYLTGSCRLNFTGTPVFENVSVRYGGSDTTTIIKLKDGASIYLPTAEGAKITVDKSVLVTTDEQTGLNHYVCDPDQQSSEYAIDPSAGECDLRVLAIGNDSSRDSMFYLDKLAALTGYRIQASYLYKQDANLRDHALAMALDDYAYGFYVTDLTTGELVQASAATTVANALDSAQWDVVILQQGTTVGWPTTYNADLEYLIDYIRDVEPDADLYWNMTWANEADCDTEYAYFGMAYNGELGYAETAGYNGDQKAMYNAIVNCIDKYIPVGEGGFDGRILTGTAIQNLRDTYGDTLTRDGYHLSLQGGRLTAAMTMLKELIPAADLDLITTDALEEILVDEDVYAVCTKGKNNAETYENTEEQLELVKDAVEEAAETDVPSKLQADPLPENPNADVTVWPTEMPLSARFPDVVKLKDGTLVASLGVHMGHATWTETGMREGYGKFYVISGNEDGTEWNTAEPLLVIDEAQLEEWGLFEFSDRYARIKEDPSIANSVIVGAVFGDFNMEVFEMEMDGNTANGKEEVLFATFWGNTYPQTGELVRHGFMTWSTDGGETWATPQKNTDNLGQPSLKRGDGAVFPEDGQILLPHYGFYNVGSCLWQWNIETQRWDFVRGSQIPNEYADEAGNFNEIALIAPNGDDLVFAFVKSSGAVMKSEDRGQTWEPIANEPGTINQATCIMLDENRIFVAWSVPKDSTIHDKPTGSRNIYGKVFYWNGDWTESASNLIYASPDDDPHDAGNPGCALLDDGRILVLSYDVAVNYSLVGVYVDPNEDIWQPIELRDTGKSIISQQTYENRDLTQSVELPANLPDSYTVELEVVFDSANASVSVPTTAGTVVVTPAKVTCGAQEKALSLALNQKTCIRVSVTCGQAYVKVWQGAEPEAWTAVGDVTEAQNGDITGTGAKLQSLTVSKQLLITMPGTLFGMPGLTNDKLKNVYVYPVKAHGDVVFTSSDPDVAAVDENGVVTFVSNGTAVITATVDGVTKECVVTVSDAHGTHAGWQTLPISGAIAGYYVVPEGGLKMTDQITIGADTTICLNGQTIIPYNNTEHVIYVHDGATLTLCDCAGGGKIDASTIGTTTCKGTIRLNSANCDMYGGTIIGHTSSAGYSGGVFVYGATSVFNMYGGEIIGNTGTTGAGGGVLVRNGTFNLYDGLISGNTSASTGNGGGVYVRQGGQLNMYGGQITDNTGVLGGGVSVAADGFFTMYDGQITGNTSSLGGGVYCADGAAFNMQGGVIEDNTSTRETYKYDVFLKGTNTFAISGNSVIGQNGMGYETPEQVTGTIGNLTSGASIYAAQPNAVETDTTVKSQQDATTDLKHYMADCSVEATRMELDNSLNMQFSVPMDQQTDWTGAYAEIKRGSETTTVPYAKWITLAADNLYVVPFEGVAAKEMTDEVVVTIYDAEGNQIGASYTDSVRKYAMRILADENEQDAWKLMVDMLNYGAAAQEFFGYKTDDLANAELTEDQKDLATQGNVDVTSTALSGTISRLNLENRIELQIVIPEAYKAQTIRYSFTNHYNEPVEGTPEIKVDAAKGYSYIAIDKIVVADANQMVSVFAGETEIARDSVASYVARMDGSSSTTDPLYQTIMKFANAAKEYFALNNIGEE